MNCNVCGFVGRDGDTFCSSCGKPLAGPETDVVEQIEAEPGTVTWRGREVAVGILLILFCVIPVTGIAILSGKFAGRFETAIGAWESSHLMGLAILIIVALRPSFAPPIHLVTGSSTAHHFRPLIRAVGGGGVGRQSAGNFSLHHFG